LTERWQDIQGAASLQVGTAYLVLSDHRRPTSAALKKPRHDLTVLTNLFTGLPALPC
jgi:NAD(P)H-dependent flavin oxidoreductase YrpB (nitropropane dioxygenase family)